MTVAARWAILEGMDALLACSALDIVRRHIPDKLALFRDCDARRTIALPGIGSHVSVDFWAPIMVAHLEAEGRLDACEDDADVLVTLIECLLQTDFADLSKCPQLRRRSLEIAIEIETLRHVLRRHTERN